VRKGLSRIQSGTGGALGGVQLILMIIFNSFYKLPLDALGAGLGLAGVWRAANSLRKASRFLVDGVFVLTAEGGTLDVMLLIGGLVDVAVAPVAVTILELGLGAGVLKGGRSAFSLSRSFSFSFSSINLPSPAFLVVPRNSQNLR